MIPRSRPVLPFPVAHCAWGLVAGLALLVAVERVMSLPGPSPHDGEGNCASCHLHDPDSAEDEASRVLLIRDVDILCQECHRDESGLSHPSNIQVFEKTPEEFPLDWAGRITCATCHYTHRQNRPDVTGYLIRSETMGRRFCQQCHDALPSRGAGKHSAALDRSHLAGMNPERAGRGLLDEGSLQCLGCHDGSIATSSSITTSTRGGGSWNHLGSAGLTHPIGVDYPPKSAKARGYRPAASLDRRIRLYNGKVGCGSCHEPYSQSKHGLVMDNTGSALCLECHKM